MKWDIPFSCPPLKTNIPAEKTAGIFVYGGDEGDLDLGNLQIHLMP